MINSSINTEGKITDNTNGNRLTLDKIDISILSPMMKQYVETRLPLGDTILFYRLGDFYEMFFDDAIYVSKTLELTLTQRDCGSNLRAPMCGVPYHAYLTYANRLLASGHKIAICDQLEDPSMAKGIVKRGITKILTPGTLTDSNAIDDKRNNFLMSIYCIGRQYGVSVADITTGEFEGTQLTFIDNDEHLINLIGKYKPSEIIVNPDFEVTKAYKTIKQAFHIAFTTRNDRSFSVKRIQEHASTKSIIGKDSFTNPELVMCSAGGLLTYADETQTDTVYHLDNFKIIKLTDTMELDISTRTNLELTSTIRTNSKKGSLLWAIDRTKTAMGGRLLRSFVEAPLIDVNQINARLDAVSLCYDKFIARQEIIECLTGLYDIERLASKVALGNCNARDLLSLKNSLSKLPFIYDRVQEFDSVGLFKDIKSMLDPMQDIYELLEASINEDAPLTIKEGDIIKRGFNSECDEIADIASNAKNYIMQIEAREREKTGIKTLKIGYNRVFGYYIEISKAQTVNAPETYIRKQTLTNGERYVTEELKELEDKILSSSSRRNTLEYEIFCSIREKVSKEQDRLFATVKACALLDVITSLAELATNENYVRPIIDDSEVIEITDGRHPVIEQVLSKDDGFVPNDTCINTEDRLMILTGPNMAGKSTYMRQVALIVLMAQMGSFVPASYAHIGLVDRIFTRIGASDDISLGQSTFMVEMMEVSNILRNSTRRSLLLLDEVGRGTSTYDGLSIAWSVIEYIINPNTLYSRTIFATHYHELNQLERVTKGVFNSHVEVKENDEGVVFLHKISSGGTSNSYGLEVARLAGIPTEVLNRGKDILSELERIGDFKVDSNLGSFENISEQRQIDTNLFSAENMSFKKNDPIREMISSIDITKLTPIEAMNILYQLGEMVDKEGNN